LVADLTTLLFYFSRIICKKL